MCGEQKTVCGNRFSPSTTPVPGIKLSSSDLVAGDLTFWVISCALGPGIFFLLLIICVNVWVWVCARERSASRAQKKVSSPWSWSCRQFWTARCGCWEPNCGPLQKQAVLLTKEHLSSPHVYILIRWDLVSDNKTFNVSFFVNRLKSFLIFILNCKYLLGFEESKFLSTHGHFSAHSYSNVVFSLYLSLTYLSVIKRTWMFILSCKNFFFLRKPFVSLIPNFFVILWVLQLTWRKENTIEVSHLDII